MAAAAGEERVARAKAEAERAEQARAEAERRKLEQERAKAAEKAQTEAAANRAKEEQAARERAEADAAAQADAEAAAAAAGLETTKAKAKALLGIDLSDQQAIDINLFSEVKKHENLFPYAVGIILSGEEAFKEAPEGRVEGLYTDCVGVQGHIRMVLDDPDWPNYRSLNEVLFANDRMGQTKHEFTDGLFDPFKCALSEILSKHRKSLLLWDPRTASHFDGNNATPTPAPAKVKEIIALRWVTWAQYTVPKSRAWDNKKKYSWCKDVFDFILTGTIPQFVSQYVEIKEDVLPSVITDTGLTLTSRLNELGLSSAELSPEQMQAIIEFWGCLRNGQPPRDAYGRLDARTQVQYSTNERVVMIGSIQRKDWASASIKKAISAFNALGDSEAGSEFTPALDIALSRASSAIGRFVNPNELRKMQMSIPIKMSMTAEGSTKFVIYQPTFMWFKSSSIYQPMAFLPEDFYAYNKVKWYDNKLEKVPNDAYAYQLEDFAGSIPEAAVNAAVPGGNFSRAAGLPDDDKDFGR